MWQAAAPNDQALDRAGDVEGRRTEAGVDVDQQRHVAHVGDAAHVGQHVVHGVDAQVRQAQRAGGDAAARQVDGAVAGAPGQQRMVGVDGADDLQRAFFGQRATEQGAGRFGSGHGWSPCMWTGCSGRPRAVGVPVRGGPGAGSWLASDLTSGPENKSVPCATIVCDAFAAAQADRCICRVAGVRRRLAGGRRSHCAHGAAHRRPVNGPANGPNFLARPDYFSRSFTPSRSSSSSFSVKSRRSREKASISRPSTRLYSPFSVMTGTP